MAVQPSVLENPREFQIKLEQILLMLNDKYVELEQWFTDHLKPLLIVDNYNYFAAHIALRQLSESKAGNFNRIKVVLERVYMMARLNEDTKFMAEYIRFANNGKDEVSMELIASISSIVSCDGNPPGGAVLKLHRLYKSENPPDVSLLRSYDVIKHLVNNVYTPGRTAQREMKIWLIAYAAFWNPTTDGNKDVESGYDRLLRLSNLLEQVIMSMSNLADNLAELIKESRYFLNLHSEPICATAMVVWLKHKLFDDDFYEWTAFSQGEDPAAFHLLDEVFLLIT